MTIIIKLILTMIISLVITPLIKIVTFRLGAVDYPNERRVNTVPMATAGGVSIFITFTFSSLFLFGPVVNHFVKPIILAAFIIVVVGFIDDVKELKPWQKMLGILIAGLVVIFKAGIKIETIRLFYFGTINLGWLSVPMTLLWIAAITNAMNLIDGLDGLASGVSIISLSTMGIIGYFFLHSETVYVPIVIFVLVASVMGFYPYNMYPAKIYLGDTGALFLGFMISVLSLEGLKNATFISLMSLVIVLGVPIMDTVFAMVRRKNNKQPLTSADKKHLHHQLMALGFTHRGAVMTIYVLALIFSFIALLINYTNLLGGVLLIITALLGLELFVELISLAGDHHKPMLWLFRMIGNKPFRDQELKKRGIKK